MSLPSVNSTDVKHSIAGFYYQLLIACNELVSITNYPNGYVGVEYGADIRVNKGNDRFIEAKFYKNDTFSRYSEAIRHTIYNFYHTYRTTKTSGTFNINTNVPISKSGIEFFDNWNKGDFKDPSDYIHYVKDCLVYEYIEKKPIKQVFEDFKSTHKSKFPEQKKPQYKSELIKQLKLDHKNYMKYIPHDILISDEDIFNFIKQVSFNFPTKKTEKYDSVIRLKEDTEKKLMILYPGFSVQQYENIRHLIMNSFLDTTVDTNNHAINVSKLDELVKNHEEDIIQLISHDSLVKTIIEIEKELVKYEKKLRVKGFSNQMEHILKVVGVCTEQWIQELKTHGEKTVNSRYLMSAEHPYPLNIIDLFKTMGEISSIAEDDLGEVQLVNLEGINNFGFTSYKEFSLKTTPSSSDREDEQTLITTFIEHSLKEQEYLKAIGDETIVFDAQCKICNYDKIEIENIVMDIARPFGSIVQQSFYQSFQYKCTKCLKLVTHDDKCSFANDIKKGL
ncbi:hypothetical protein H7992_23660 [Sporosarcina sp. resist]|uniref:hypothetical protein n=1 Tax=Sporosarcina sp. resist TaxID=2762563 RepID=UPI00164E30F6|nr:hypothetical protein [Sporosarcina sp. resist]QNK88099.1 hypothetical protein H7992_23660 [Sporosarcina sp. resist]